MSGALLMANLQANLRSQYAMAVNDLGRLLESVNRLFCENTADSSFATLFFADYDDFTRRLRYVNCGHLPGLLLRAGQGSQGGSDESRGVDRLESTSTVAGLFDDWHCDVAEAKLAPGDTAGAVHGRRQRGSARRWGTIWRVPRDRHDAGPLPFVPCGTARSDC